MPEHILTCSAKPTDQEALEMFRNFRKHSELTGTKLSYSIINALKPYHDEIIQPQLKQIKESNG